MVESCWCSRLPTPAAVRSMLESAAAMCSPSTLISELDSPPSSLQVTAPAAPAVAAAVPVVSAAVLVLSKTV